MRGINGCHEDVGAEGFAGIERSGLSRHVGIQFIDADVLQVNVGDERVDDFVFGLAHVALQLGEHGDGSDGGHLLEHIVRPVFAHIVLAGRHVGRQVGSRDGLLSWIGDEL